MVGTVRVGAHGARHARAAELAQERRRGEHLLAGVVRPRRVHLHHAARGRARLGGLLVERRHVEGRIVGELLGQVGMRHHVERNVRGHGVAPQLEVAAPDGVGRARLVPAAALRGVVEGPGVHEMHRAQHELERGQVVGRDGAVVVGSEPVQLAARDDLEARVPLARLADRRQVLPHARGRHGQVVPRVERLGERVVLRHGEGRDAGRLGRGCELLHRALAVPAERGMRVRGHQLHVP